MSVNARARKTNPISPVSKNGGRPVGSPKSPSGGPSYPVLRQRGYYSDILSNNARKEIGVSTNLK